MIRWVEDYPIFEFYIFGTVPLTCLYFIPCNEQVLLATGRVANTEPLNLSAAGITNPTGLWGGGYITVDKYQNTATKGVYALGDVCGKVELTPMAIAAGRRLADRYLEYVLLFF